jgi:hypothetical protein
MQRKCKIITRMVLVALLGVLGGVWTSARGDLIRSSPSRTFPDIAGDIVGAQTYTFDPVTQTGTFRLMNAPHLIALGPSVKDMVHMLPEPDGTLSQVLRMKLDRNGRLLEHPGNTFQIRGTVVIGEKTYEGSLLEGRPTAFGASAQPTSPATNKNAEVFDLYVQITGGELAEAFGPEAYLRITPQAKSTFNGRFTVDFSSEKPLTNLRAARRALPASVPEPTTLLTLLTCSGALVASRLRRYFKRAPRRRGDA